MNTLFYSFLGILAFAGVVYFLRRKFQAYGRVQAQLQQETIALQQEKKVIYEFLHDLGEAFTEDIDRDHLLRIIVTCARKVTAARGAAIYLWNPEHDSLRAAIVTGFFPPPVKIDNVVADQLADRPEDLEAFLRLESIPGQSRAVIARVAQSGAPVLPRTRSWMSAFRGSGRRRCRRIATWPCRCIIATSNSASSPSQIPRAALRSPRPIST